MHVAPVVRRLEYQRNHVYKLAKIDQSWFGHLFLGTSAKLFLEHASSENPNKLVY